MRLSKAFELINVEIAVLKTLFVFFRRVPEALLACTGKMNIFVTTANTTPCMFGIMNHKVFITK